MYGVRRNLNKTTARAELAKTVYSIHKPIKLALLISGTGTTMEAIIKACQNGTISGIEPALLIASNNNKATNAIKKATALGILPNNIVVIKPRDFQNENAFGEEIIKECKKRKINLIGQYGWMAKTPENVIKKFSDMIINQHPGPLDPPRLDFGGKGMYGSRVHRARLCFVRKTNRDFWTEATCHRVTNDYDKGAVLKRKRVPILPNDTAETLKERVLLVEHEIQIETLIDFANNNVKELLREEPLVRQGEEKILEECKIFI